MSFTFMEHSFNDYFRDVKNNVIRKHQMTKESISDLSLWQNGDRKQTMRFESDFMFEHGATFNINFSRPRQTYRFDRNQMFQIVSDKLNWDKEQEAVLADIAKPT